MIDPAAFRAGLGVEVRALRARRRLTQARLAERVPRMTANGVSELECGRSNPSVTRVMQLADALRVSSAELVAAAERNAVLLQAR